MTHALQIMNLLDAFNAYGYALTNIFEHHQPGALRAIREWAQARGREVRIYEHSGMQVHRLDMPKGGYVDVYVVHSLSEAPLLTPFAAESHP